MAHCMVVKMGFKHKIPLLLALAPYLVLAAFGLTSMGTVEWVCDFSEKGLQIRKSLCLYPECIFP